MRSLPVLPVPRLPPRAHGPATLQAPPDQTRQGPQDCCQRREADRHTDTRTTEAQACGKGVAGGQCRPAAWAPQGDGPAASARPPSPPLACTPLPAEAQTGGFIPEVPFSSSLTPTPPCDDKDTREDPVAHRAAVLGRLPRLCPARWGLWLPQGQESRGGPDSCRPTTAGPGCVCRAAPSPCLPCSGPPAG